MEEATTAEAEQSSLRLDRQLSGAGMTLASLGGGADGARADIAGSKAASSPCIFPPLNPRCSSQTVVLSLHPPASTRATSSQLPLSSQREVQQASRGGARGVQKSKSEPNVRQLMAPSAIAYARREPHGVMRCSTAGAVEEEVDIEVFELYDQASTPAHGSYPSQSQRLSSGATAEGQWPPTAASFGSDSSSSCSMGELAPSPERRPTQKVQGLNSRHRQRQSRGSAASSRAASTSRPLSFSSQPGQVAHGEDDTDDHDDDDAAAPCTSKAKRRSAASSSSILAAVGGKAKRSKSNSSKTNDAEDDGDADARRKKSKGYRPYSLNSYKAMMEQVAHARVGGLGPSDTDEQRQARTKQQRAIDYGRKASRAARMALAQPPSSTLSSTAATPLKQAGAERCSTSNAEEKQLPTDDHDDSIEGQTTATAAAAVRLETPEAYGEEEAQQQQKHQRRSSPPPPVATKDRHNSTGSSFAVTTKSVAAQRLARQRREKALAYGNRVTKKAKEEAAAAAALNSGGALLGHKKQDARDLSDSPWRHSGHPEDAVSLARQHRLADLEAVHEQRKSTVDAIRRKLRVPASDV